MSILNERSANVKEQSDNENQKTTMFLSKQNKRTKARAPLFNERSVNVNVKKFFHVLHYC